VAIDLDRGSDYAQIAETVRGIVERDALDEAGQDFPVQGRGARLQPDIHKVPSSAAVNNSLMMENCRARSAAASGLSRNGSSYSSIWAERASCTIRSCSIRAMWVCNSSGVNGPLTRATNRTSLKVGC
jgi:hypothetical protein